jgi:hypothetical protein
MWQRQPPEPSPMRYSRFDTPLMHWTAKLAGSTSHVPPSLAQHVFDIVTPSEVALVRTKYGYVWVVSLLFMQ